MIVGKIWDSEYPWDVRVEKVCRSLVESGHQVELVCRNRRREALLERRDGVTIHRMPVLARLPAALDRASSFPAFINPRWYRHTSRVFNDCHIDVILCRDLPLAPMALAVGRALRRPVVLDLAEHYPGLLKDLYNPHDFRWVNLLVRNPMLAALVERYVVTRVDRVLVVVDEMAARLAILGVDPTRITIVSNTPSADRLARLETRRRAGRPGDRLRLVYLGNVERSRGLGVVLEALALITDTPLRVTLDVFGDGSSLDLHRRRAEQMKLGDRVIFHGRHPYDSILDRLGEYDVGLIPHHATDHWNYTIQNKLFDYMAAGLATIVSSMPPAARIVNDTGAGRVFQDRDSGSLRDAILELGRPGEAEECGERGRAAVHSKFNWALDSGRLAAAIESVTASTLPENVGSRPEPHRARSRADAQ